ncbi:MAG: hypothetical protein ABI880_07495 [Acidobacteriota bacterium]
MHLSSQTMKFDDFLAESMSALFGSAGRALLAVVVVALTVDALLGGLNGALSGFLGAPAGPWWMTGHVLERSRWVVFVLLFNASARWWLGSEALDASLPAPAVWRLVGTLAILVPLVWIVAQWLVLATLFTVAGRWDIDGLTYLSVDYYRRVFAGYAPWLLGGAAALVGSRHVL